MRSVVVLGSTGSIGTQALQIIGANPERFTVGALAAGGNVDLLARQAVASRAPVLALAAADRVDQLVAALAELGDPGYRPEILSGPDAAAQVAGAAPVGDPGSTTVVLNGITGAIGLAPTLASLRAGHTLALANKESLIIGGALVKGAAAPGQVVPVDSEHSAIAQCLRAGTGAEVRRLVLTASGGPFRGRRRAELHGVTVAEALVHPNFAMGQVITINSATLVNKGLEVIEANLLFDVPLERVDVVVHPQQMVHSMVEFVDGATVAQASPPTMGIPIALGLGWPDRVPDAGPGCDWTRASTWSFEPLDDEAFPSVSLARAAGIAGGTAPAVYNATNEVCVQAFIDRRIPFTAIVDTIARVMDDPGAGSTTGDLGLDDVLAADAWARARASTLIG